MSEKKRKSITFDEDNYEFLSNHDNASALVRDLVEQYRTDGNREKAALKLRQEQKQRELESARDEVKRVENDLKEITELLQEVEEVEADQWDEAVEALSNAPKEPDNPAIENWADKLGVTPTQLIEELDEDNR